MRQFEVNLGGEGEGCTVVVRGCDCRTEDFTMELVAFLKSRRNAYLGQPLGKTEQLKTKKPCGCKDDAG